MPSASAGVPLSHPTGLIPWMAPSPKIINTHLSAPISTCGNHVVEGWEECDCGADDLDCHETCCHPASHPTSPCQLRSGASCSPSEGPCCQFNCTFADGNICRDETECGRVAKCDGSSAYCPKVFPKRQGNTCQGGTKVSQTCLPMLCELLNPI